MVSGPETPYVVDAIDGLLRGDLVAARLALLDGAAVSGWDAIAHRIDVAGHALAVDAGLLDPGDNPDGSPDGDVVFLPGLDTSWWSRGHGRNARTVIEQWTKGGGPLSLDLIWPSLTVVAWLVQRAGYPAEVVC